jgi:hypothetical protein
MPVWRCPHCGTPQAESSRCWVCRRSTTTCATCRHFRRAIASGLGLCGLDPRHAALDGTEIRACWVAAQPHLAGTGDVLPRELAPDLDLGNGGRSPARTFVPVDELDDPSRRPAVAVVDRPATDAPERAASSPAGWSLWGEPEG